MWVTQNLFSLQLIHFLLVHALKFFIFDLDFVHVNWNVYSKISRVKHLVHSLRRYLIFIGTERCGHIDWVAIRATHHLLSLRQINHLHRIHPVISLVTESRLLLSRFIKLGGSLIVWYELVIYGRSRLILTAFHGRLTHELLLLAVFLVCWSGIQSIALLFLLQSVTLAFMCLIGQVDILNLHLLRNILVFS